MKAVVIRDGGMAAAIDCVELSEPTLFFLKLCAAHDGVSERELLTKLICQRCDAIGLAGLLDASGDIHAVPEFRRANVGRADKAREAAKRWLRGVGEPYFPTPDCPLPSADSSRGAG